ncbi:MAG: hypothetical protein IT379_32045 [Deltaproteobacteria bacterium]|nr:hypothetical protein [Deltaproteobacteria bacterium]
MDERLLKIAALLGRAEALLEVFERDRGSNWTEGGGHALEEAQRAIAAALLVVAGEPPEVDRG